VDSCQPTTRREKTSVTNATETQPANVGDVGHPKAVPCGRGEGSRDEVFRSHGRRAWYRGSRALLARDTPQPVAAHQPLDGAPGDPLTLTVQLGMHLSDSVNAVVALVDSANLLDHHRIADRSSRQRPGLRRVVGNWDDRQLCADRLDHQPVPMRIDELDHLLCGRSSSAAKKADAVFKIAFERRNSRFSRSNSRMRFASVVLTPARPP
jgi:hypothetical protein